MEDVHLSYDSSLELNYAPWLPPDKDASILDLGCGNGRMLRFLASKGYRHLYGIDRDGDALKLAADVPGAIVRCLDMSSEDFGAYEGRFKLIILRQMIYYVDRGDIVLFLRSLSEALTPDGTIIVEFFNGSLLSSRLTELKDPFIRTSYTEHSIRRLFDACDLHTRHIGPELRVARFFRSHLYALLRSIWILILKSIFVLERGMDNELPRFYSKSLIAVASRGR